MKFSTKILTAGIRQKFRFHYLSIAVVIDIAGA